MFEKESKEYENNAEYVDIDDYGHKIYDSIDIELAYQKGAEFGYNKAKEDADKMKSQFLELCNLKDMRIADLEKANEWHYVKEELPKKQYDKVTVTVAYLNAFKNPCKRDCFYDGKDFVYWDSGKNVGWKNVNIFGTIYAWKYVDDFIPEPPKESK